MTTEGSKPIPDPTSLTTDALRREVGALRELLETRIVSGRELADERMSILDRFLSAVQTHVDTVLHERDKQYLERDRRYEERFNHSEAAVAIAFNSAKEAVAAAFEAAEKAISKAEISIEKRADATYVALSELQRILASLMARTETEQRFSEVQARLGELGSRMDRNEGRATGAGQLWGFILGAAGFVAAVVAILSRFAAG